MRNRNRVAAATALAVGLALAAEAPASAATSCGFLGLFCQAPPTTTAPVTVSPVTVPPVTVPVVEVPPVSVTLAPAPAPAGLGIGEEAGAADRLLALVNAERAAAHLPLLELRPAITAIAAGHSVEMATRADIFHNLAYFTSATRARLSASALGENVAVNGSLENAHVRLMASPGHRANILNGRFDAVGISVVHDDGGTVYITEDFLDSKAPVKAKARRAHTTRRRHAGRR